MTMALPQRPWQRLPGAIAILKALDADTGLTRVVGGAVRDALLDLPVADVDLATSLKPQQVMDRLIAAGIKAVPTGIDHGTVTAVAPDMVMEVTTLRRDVSTDGRRASIAYTDDWKEDAARRDFTINALSADPASGRIFDYFGGLADLEQRRVRFIGTALERIAEDHLRILRFFRFHARFGGGEPDAEAVAACTARANDLMALSRERIRDELLKLLGAADPLDAVALMMACGIFRPVVPEITDDALPMLRSLIAAEKQADVAPLGLRRLAALLPPQPVLADAVARRLKLSNADRQRLTMAAARGDGSTDDPHVLAYRLGREQAVDRLLLANAPAPAVRLLDDWQRPRLPMTGGDIVARGVQRGPAVSALLRAVEEDWIAAGFPDDRSMVEGMLRARLASMDQREAR